MPSNPIDEILPSAIASHNRSVDYLGTQTIFLRLVVTAINTARVTGLFTATIALGSTTSGDIQWVVDLLRQSGYGVTFSTTNIVVTW